MEKLDLRKQYKWLYSPSAKKVEYVDVPPLLFARVDGAVPAGTGPSDAADFKEAVAALYGLSYTLRFMVKKRAIDPIDYPVMYLEGLWVTESRTYDTAAREAMTFTVMIMQPDFITADLPPSRRRSCGWRPTPPNMGMRSAAITRSTWATHFAPRRRS